MFPMHWCNIAVQYMTTHPLWRGAIPFAPTLRKGFVGFGIFVRPDWLNDRTITASLSAKNGGKGKRIPVAHPAKESSLRYYSGPWGIWYIYSRRGMAPPKESTLILAYICLLRKRLGLPWLNTWSCVFGDGLETLKLKLCEFKVWQLTVLEFSCIWEPILSNWAISATDATNPSFSNTCLPKAESERREVILPLGIDKTR